MQLHTCAKLIRNHPKKEPGSKYNGNGFLAEWKRRRVNYVLLLFWYVFLINYNRVSSISSPKSQNLSNAEQIFYRQNILETQYWPPLSYFLHSPAWNLFVKFEAAALAKVIWIYEQSGTDHNMKLTNIYKQGQTVHWSEVIDA